jgi:hypothetical protein
MSETGFSGIGRPSPFSRTTISIRNGSRSSGAAREYIGPA